MSEIITPIIESEGNAVITEKHTIADIYRWLIENDYWQTLQTLHKLESSE